MNLCVKFQNGMLFLMNGDEKIAPLFGGSVASSDAPYFRDPSFLNHHLRRHAGRDATVEEVTFWAGVISSEIADMIRWWEWTRAVREGKVVVGAA